EYIFSEPFKFADESGNIFEKNALLVYKDGLYKEKANNIDIAFGELSSDGTSIGYADEYFIVRPLFGASVKATIDKKNNLLEYPGAFGEGTLLLYYPQLNGFKTEIVIDENMPGSFEFELESSLDFNPETGLFEYGGGVFLNLGELLIYDSDGNYGNGEMSLDFSEGKGILSINVDPDFLNTAAYPVTIDPVVTVSDPLNGSNSILDAPIFSGKPNTGHSTYVYLSMGYVDTTFGVSRVMMRFPGLTNGTEYTAIHTSQIASATVNLWDASGHAARFVNVYANDHVTSAWAETVKWNDVGEYYTQENWGKSMSAAVWTSFNITSYIKGCKNGTYDADKGLIFINENEDTRSKGKSAYSSEKANTTYNPYVTLTYGSTLDATYYIQNCGTGRYVDIRNQSTSSGAVIQQWHYTGGTNMKWELFDQGDGSYAIKSKFSNLYMGFSSSDTNTVKQYSTISSYTKWNVTRTSSGNFKIINVQTGKALTVPFAYNTEGMALTALTYADDNMYYDEWSLYSPSSYGSRAYKSLHYDADDDSGERTEINCHGYSFGRSDWPSLCTITEIINYYSSPDDIDTITADFVTNHLIPWINSEYTENLEWNSINASTNINSGQYRIVFRMGRNQSIGQIDYHFWYETLDGRWANKHGQLEEELLGAGVVPTSTNTSGWNLDFTSIGGPCYTNFYNSTIYYYVLNMEAVQ
ncbi:MAG: RICIN domain-containing protein, partial [Clostridia bacterium]|nr:RICIN domain-containing protein [Clostridia bacterium]